MAKNEDYVVAKELRERSEAELKSLLEAKTEDLHQLRFKKALGQLDRPHAAKLLRRDIAKINTVLHEMATAARGEQA